MSRPAVSVLVPIYNVEKYLEECLDSIINQTLTNIEIICINDGSTDNSLKIIKKYAKNDPRIVIISKKNSGYGDSMNKGLKKATGEYIGIVESDDWIELDALEKLYKLAKDNNVEVVKANYYNYYTTPEKAAQDGTIFHLVNSSEANKVINPRENQSIFYQKPAIWTGLYKKEFLDTNTIQFLPSPGASYQDTGFSFKVWSSAEKVYFTEEAFLHYRQDNEASSINNPGKVFCVSDEFAEIERFLKEKDLYGVFGPLMRIAKWGSYTWNIERLKADLAEDFIRKASGEYKKDYEDGVFNFEFCGPNQVRAISEIIHSPDTTIQRKYASENAKVAIVIPCYNVESFVQRSIDSALSQTLTDIEIILVDDGSTDDTADILERAYQSDPRIHLINTTNGGLSAARNVGIAESTAPYLAFLDSDDYYEPHAIEQLVKAIEKTNSSVSVGSIRVIYNDKRLTAIEKNNDKQYYTVKLSGVHQITESVLKKVDVSSCNKLFKRQIIERFDIHFPYGLKYEDAFFFNTYCMVANSIAFLPRDIYIYNYVRRQGSIMSNTFSGASRTAYDHLEVAVGIYDFMTTNNLVKQWGKYFLTIFSEYYHFALRWSPQSGHARINNRARNFIEYNKESLASISPDALKTLRKLLPAQGDNTVNKNALMSKVRRKATRIAKKVVKPAVHKLSPTHRSYRRLAETLSDLHHKVDSLEERHLTFENNLSRRLDELERHVTSHNKPQQ